VNRRSPAKYPNVRVRVLHFAVVRERVGSDTEELELPHGATVADAVAALVARHPALDAIVPRLRTAVNRTFAEPAAALADGDELALIPPVAGGSGTATRLVDVPLSLDAVVDAVRSPGQGAIVTFTGTVRRHGQRAGVVRLEYEAFAAMALDVMRALVAELEAEWPGARVAIHHRTGALAVGDTAVVIAASAPHRADAFAACRAAIDRLKERAPIWKKEIFEDGESWVGLGP
jgi:molybdopterin synthase catalytic subunit